MHKLYLEECKKNGIDNPIGKSTYKNHFKEQDLKIHKAKKDQCKICTKYSRSNAEDKAKLKEAYDLHIKNKNEVIKLR